MDTNQAGEKNFGPEESSSQMMGRVIPVAACHGMSEGTEEQISASRSYTDSADPHNTCPAPTLKPFSTGSGGGGSYTAVKTTSVSESCIYCNNGLEEIEETTTTSINQIRRIQNDGPEDDIGNPIQYDDGSDCYLKLNDNDEEPYKLEMSKYFPAKDDPHREKYLFKWIPSKSIPRAGLLTVQECYIVLDASSSPPKYLKIVPPQEKPADTDGAALIHRYEEEIPEFCMLFFSYEGKCYQIKVENGVPIVEERKSENDLKKDYMWKGLL